MVLINNKDKHRIACIGEVMLEMSKPAQSKNALIGFAGDTYNTAVYLRRLLSREHFDVAYVSVLGQDALSSELLAMMADEHIDCRAIGRHENRQIGAYASITNSEGERDFVYWRTQSAARTLFQTKLGEPDFSVLAQFDTLFFSAITLAILPESIRLSLFEWLVQFRQNGGCVIFDSNYRPALWPEQKVARESIDRAWQLTDIALPSVDDEMAIFNDPSVGHCIARLSAYTFTHCALKQGAQGPHYFGAEPIAAQHFRAATQVVDTTAAGDSFNAGFLAAVLSGEDIACALAAGHALASRVVAHRGAIIPRDQFSKPL